jgi:hypothetical protein
MATDQTAGVPPSFGNTSFVNIGWTENSRNADRKTTMQKAGKTTRGAPNRKGDEEVIFTTHDTPVGLLLSSILPPRTSISLTETPLA